MSKTNKELAVELYCAFMQASGAMFSSPNYTGTVNWPSVDEMVNTIKDMQEKLSFVEDN